MKLYFISIAGLLLFLCSCVSEKKADRIQNQPRIVAKHWLENYYYKNNYEEAKLYSTARTASMIDTIKTLIFPEFGESSIQFEIKSVNCKEVKKSAECTCTYLDGGEEFKEVLSLINEDGQWLVDAEILNDDEMLQDEDIDSMTKEFEESLEKLLQQ